MKLRDIRDAYETLSGKASKIVRQLSLAGVALVWLFRSGQIDAPGLDLPLKRAALLFFLALFLDFLQYLSGTMIWHAYFAYKESQCVELEAEVTAPAQLNWPPWIIFYVKSLTVVFAYSWYVLPFLIRKFANG